MTRRDTASTSNKKDIMIGASVCVPPIIALTKSNNGRYLSAATIIVVSVLLIFQFSIPNTTSINNTQNKNNHSWLLTNNDDSRPKYISYKLIKGQDRTMPILQEAITNRLESIQKCRLYAVEKRAGNRLSMSILEQDGMTDFHTKIHTNLHSNKNTYYYT